MQPGFRGGSGDPLLLVHGLGACWQVWEPVLDLLTVRYEVSAPDLPGFGSAPPLEGRRPSIAALADRLEEHLDDLGWSTAHLVGNSLGGQLVLELARRGRARTVTALSPGGMQQGWEDVMARGLLRSQAHLGQLLRPLLPWVGRSGLVRTLTMSNAFAHPSQLDPAYAERMARAFVDAEAVLATLDALHDEPADGDLGDVTCPTTIAWGTRDRLLLPRQGERFKAAIPHARLVRLAGLGHSPMPEDPELVARVIRATTTAAA